MSVIVIINGDRRVGFQSACRFWEQGHSVCITASRTWIERRVAKAGIFFVQLDVTSDESVAAAASAVKEKFGHVDVLINNNMDGFLGGESELGEVTVEQMRHVYETNVFGVVRVIQAFLPLLEASDDPSIINVGSESGSFAVVSDPENWQSKQVSVIYGSSKAALSMLTLQYAKGLPHMRVNLVASGFTHTDFLARPISSVTEGTEALVRLVELGPEAGTGGFYTWHGRVGW